MIRNPWRRSEPLDRAELARLLPAPADPRLAADRRYLLEEHLMNEIHRSAPAPVLAPGHAPSPVLAPDLAPDPVLAPGHAPDPVLGPDLAPSPVLGPGHAPSPTLAPDLAPDPVLAPVPGAAPALASGPGRRPLRRVVLIAGPVAAVAALAVVVSLGVSPGTTTVAAPRLVKAPVVEIEEGSAVKVTSTVRELAAAATAASAPRPGPGQYIYIKSRVSFVASSVNGDTGESATWVQPLHDREVWKSPDGTKGWLDEPGYQAEGGIALGAGDPVKQLTYTWLAAQPADPDALLKFAYSTAGGAGDRDQRAFDEIGSIIREQLVPSGLAGALYEAAGRIPGVVVVEHAQDAADRDGIALARLDPRTGERSEWIFDRESRQYLGSRGVQVREVNGVRPGTVVERTAIVTRAVVDAEKQRPGAGRAKA
ncbi:CU044_5270 family protein [Kitasatospora griseola]|uniref:CU044_5270 family protein n=1 Tax=Kitasatospora griseola TaxID=2064 RepID=UPI0037F47B59